MSTAGDVRPAHSQSGAEHIGPAVRAAREAQGISLRALARQIGVSPSFVSQLEHQKANASVGTLYALVEALGLSVDQLMTGDAKGYRAGAAAPGPAWTARSGVHVSQFGEVREPMQRHDDRARISFPGVVWERLTKAADPLVDFLHVRYEKGSSSCPPDDMMRHGGREYGYVLSGRIRVQVGFDVYDLGPGDSITFDSMTPHRLSNPYGDAAEAVWLVVGRRDDERGHSMPPPSAEVTHLPSMRT